MANSKSDKGYILRWIFGCLAAILLFHFAWPTQYFTNLKNGLFAIVDIFLFAGFVISAVIAYLKADDPNKDNWRKVFIAFTVVSAIWAAGWAAGLNEKVL